MKKLIVLVGLVLALFSASMVYAVPLAVTNLRANPSDTSIVLIWEKGTGATSTVINYGTSGFPSAATDPTIVYDGIDFQTTITGLTPGTVYFFAAWSYDGAYSAATTLAVATLAQAIPNGGQSSDSVVIPTKSLTGLNDAPVATGFNLEPFSSIVRYFNAAPNGVGMPTGNVVETLAVLGIVVVGALIYISSRNFFIAYAVVLAASIVCAGMKILQGYVVGVEIIIGLGVWAIDNYFQ